MKFDIARRAAMKALLGSPVAAQGIVQAAAEQALGELPDAPQASEGISTGNVPISDDRDPLWELFDQKRQEFGNRYSRTRHKEVEHHMPEHVASKRSWSPAFKAHVTQREMIAHEV